MEPRMLPSRQSGATLIISLLFLVLVTLLAMAGMRGTLLQERIAGNTQNRMLAFQAAEAALSAGENDLANSALPTGTGYYMIPGTSPAVGYGDLDWAGFSWSTNSVQLAANTLAGVADQPRYVIERLTVGPPSSGSQIHAIGFGPNHGSGYFRITARGEGKTSDSVVILQETFIRD